MGNATEVIRKLQKASARIPTALQKDLTNAADEVKNILAETGLGTYGRTWQWCEYNLLFQECCRGEYGDAVRDVSVHMGAHAWSNALRTLFPLLLKEAAEAQGGDKQDAVLRHLRSLMEVFIKKAHDEPYAGAA